MHIPDGYLSPQTCAVGFVVAAPMLATAAVRVKRRVKTRNVPTLAVLAAVSFLIMMFNVPIPDGTTAHAVGAALIAILLGPWAATIAVTVALAFQALLFGDGGVLAFGVNVVNMAIVMPWVAYGAYKLVSRGATLTAPRRIVAAFLAGYAGINASALCAAAELGIQPDLFHDAAGAPLYSPYHLAQTVPAMMLAHLTVAGLAEGILSAAVLAYLQRANLPLLRANHPGVPVDAAAATAEQKRRRRLRPGVVAVAVMAVLVVLTPLGLLAPGGAFGEDSPADLQSSLGLSAVPTGLARYSDLWQSALFPDYLSGSPWTYVVSAVVGIVVVGLVVHGAGLLLVRLLNRRATEPRERVEASR
ncbi:cobalt transporter CbiM [Pseudonocardia ailaonensis]|uniref:Cobalt transporter CbiM n=1 Tax=Pseudonocardia ailaonensis TaxID=367279 RepID=A0ABN2N887_9PSEU